MEQATIDRLKELEKKASPAPWKLWTGCSWRRFGSEATGKTVCEPTNHPIDGHPDLFFSNGGEQGPDAELICEMRNHLHELLEAKEREMSCNCYKGDRIHHLDDCPAARDERLKAIEPAPAGARTVEQLIDLSKGVLPESHVAHIDKWLTSNEKSPSDVRWGLYPLGMVGRWIERGEKAEAQLSAALSAKEAAERQWWKPSDDPIQNLIKAGALIAAEIDRLKRKGEANAAAQV